MSNDINDPAYVQHVAEKVQSVIALSAFLIEDISALEATDGMARDVSGRVAALAPVLGAVGEDYEAKQMEADVRKKRAAALLQFVKTLKQTEDDRQAFFDKQKAKAKARRQLSRTMGGL